MRGSNARLRRIALGTSAIKRSLFVWRRALKPWFWHSQGMDIAVLFGFVGAIVGGTVAAVIAGRANLRLAREARRERAAEALWEYQRTLLGYAASSWFEGGYTGDSLHFATAELDDVRAAYKAAYPWSGYLSDDAKRDLFLEAWLKIGEPPYDNESVQQGAHSAHALSEILAAELDRVFPLK